ncbi:hypothetical protein BJY04DRAFT_217393 [Aspergillus karnatakaensis]|uniref:F-box protein n=1 Tax=Aspergillus karnatakaensis TaxID=1810916 RepID=UPI003CCC9157
MPKRKREAVVQPKPETQADYGSRLPVEVLQLIFSYLTPVQQHGSLWTSYCETLATVCCPPRTLYALCLTCRRFQSIAQPLLFHTVYFYQPRHHPIFLEVIRDSPRLAGYVQGVIFAAQRPCAEQPGVVLPEELKRFRSKAQKKTKIRKRFMSPNRDIRWYQGPTPPESSTVWKALKQRDLGRQWRPGDGSEDESNSGSEGEQQQEPAVVPPQRGRCGVRERYYPLESGLHLLDLLQHLPNLKTFRYRCSGVHPVNVFDLEFLPLLRHHYRAMSRSGTHFLDKLETLELAGLTSYGAKENLWRFCGPNLRALCLNTAPLESGFSKCIELHGTPRMASSLRELRIRSSNFHPDNLSSLIGCIRQLEVFEYDFYHTLKDARRDISGDLQHLITAVERHKDTLKALTVRTVHDSWAWDDTTWAPPILHVWRLAAYPALESLHVPDMLLFDEEIAKSGRSFRSNLPPILKDLTIVAWYRGESVPEMCSRLVSDVKSLPRLRTVTMECPEEEDEDWTPDHDRLVELFAAHKVKYSRRYLE